jgi:hypothetical protein
VGQSESSAWKVGLSGGRSSRTSTVIRTANAPSENALSRSGVALRNTLAAGYGADCVADNVYDSRWSGDAGDVIDSMSLYLRFHALRHVALRLRNDHSIVFGNQPAITLISCSGDAGKQVTGN